MHEEAQADRQTDMTKFVVGFRNSFAKVPKTCGLRDTKLKHGYDLEEFDAVQCGRWYQAVSKHYFTSKQIVV